MPGTRRHFLSRLALGATGAAAGLGVTPGSAAALELPHPVTDKWDLTWADRLTGRAKGLFDSPQIDDGGGLFRTVIWMNQVKEVYGLGDSEISAVLVIRHAAISMVVNDEYWATYKVGKTEKVKDWSLNKTAQRNVFLAHPSSDGKSAESPYSLQALMRRGGIVLACNLAFGQVVSEVGKREGLKGAEARARALTYLVPGVILQPSGIFAVHRAQAAGCSYILAS